MITMRAVCTIFLLTMAAAPAAADPSVHFAELRSGLAPPTISPSVLRSIERLKLSPPRRNLAYQVLRETSVFKGTPQGEDTAYTSISPGPVASVSLTLEFELPVAPNVPETFGYSATFRGFTWLHHEFRTVDPKAVAYLNDATSIDFHGDWNNMRLGTEIGLQVTGLFTDFMTHHAPETTKYKENCKIETEVEAKIYDASLTGKAKTLECEATLDGSIKDNFKMYFEDYGWFVQVKDVPNDFFYANNKIVELR